MTFMIAYRPIAKKQVRSFATQPPISIVLISMFDALKQMLTMLIRHLPLVGPTM